MSSVGVARGPSATPILWHSEQTIGTFEQHFEFLNGRSEAECAQNVFLNTPWESEWISKCIPKPDPMFVTPFQRCSSRGLCYWSWIHNEASVTIISHLDSLYISIASSKVHKSGWLRITTRCTSLCLWLRCFDALVRHVRSIAVIFRAK